MNILNKPIGIFGGTFDPIHLGHLRLANEAYADLESFCFRCHPRAGGDPAPRQTLLNIVIRLAYFFHYTRTSNCAILPLDWIPACAGMTTEAAEMTNW